TTALLYRNTCLTLIPSNLSPKRECSSKGVKFLSFGLKFGFGSGSCLLFRCSYGIIRETRKGEVLVENVILLGA
ncbi:unnamed protein product, partial [Laminaria digitata]